MNISSENIVDVFLRKISESLPVGERDEYQAWKKDQEDKAYFAATDRQNRAVRRRRNRIAAEYADLLTKFFGFDGTGCKYSISSDAYGDIIFNDDPTYENDDSIHEIARASESGRIDFYEAFEQVTQLYGLNCGVDEESSTFYIKLYGKREIIGPLYGKLKKLGFDPTRSHSVDEHYLKVTFNTNDFIEAIKKGLRITDFTDAQPE